MKFERILLGIAAGLSMGYIAVRVADAVRRAPAATSTGTAKEYAALRRRLAVSATVRSVADAYAFAYGPAGAALDRQASRLPAWLAPGAFAAAALTLQQLAEAPVSFVEDWSVERRFALTEQPARGWWSDYAKSSALSTALGILLATLAGFAVRRMPKRWPVAASVATVPLLLLANIVVPLYVLPLFNRFEPVEGPLEQRLRALATRFGVGDAHILRMNMSRQTKKANAFVTGIFSTHRIVLGDTLIESFPPDEIEFVVAHELGHYVTRDTWRMMAVAQLTSTLLYAAANAAVRDADRRRPLFIARLVASMGTAGLLTRPFVLALSRSREWAADRFAREATGNAAAGAAAFRRLREQNKSDDDIPRWYEALYASHPSLRERIAALELR